MQYLGGQMCRMYRETMRFRTVTFPALSCRDCCWSNCFPRDTCMIKLIPKGNQTRSWFSRDKPRKLPEAKNAISVIKHDFSQAHIIQLEIRTANSPILHFQALCEFADSIPCVRALRRLRMRSTNSTLKGVHCRCGGAPAQRRNSNQVVRIGGL